MSNKEDNPDKLSSADFLRSSITQDLATNRLGKETTLSNAFKYDSLGESVRAMKEAMSIPKLGTRHLLGEDSIYSSVRAMKDTISMTRLGTGNLLGEDSIYSSVRAMKDTVSMTRLGTGSLLGEDSIYSSIRAMKDAMSYPPLSTRHLLGEDSLYSSIRAMKEAISIPRFGTQMLGDESLLGGVRAAMLGVPKMSGFYEDYLSINKSLATFSTSYVNEYGTIKRFPRLENIHASYRRTLKDYGNERTVESQTTVDIIDTTAEEESKMEKLRDNLILKMNSTISNRIVTNTKPDKDYYNSLKISMVSSQEKRTYYVELNNPFHFVTYAHCYRQYLIYIVLLMSVLKAIKGIN